jgi:hypothetical protein
LGGPIAAFVLGCGAGERAGSGPSIDGVPIEPAVVEHIAARDGVDATTARARMIETLRLAAAARADRGAEAELAEARRTHLRRTALARVVLHDDFEASHRIDDLPTDDPLLVRARTEPRFVHPALHHVCQVIAAPPGKLDDETLAAKTAEPQWRARALARMEALRRHVEATVPLDDADACELMLRNTELERDPDDDTIALRSEGAGGFDLDACAEPLGSDGRCDSPRFAPEWVDAVREGPVPGLRGPFPTRFGVHLALVREVLPASLPENPGFEAELRARIHPMWTTAALGEWLTSLRTRHAALVAVGGE